MYSAPDIDKPAGPQPINASSPHIVWDYPEFDTAALEFPSDTPLPPSYLTPASQDPGPTEELFTLGYARCETLVLSAGSMRSASPLGWTTSLQGSPGMSGSPVFTGSGKVVGTLRGAVAISQMVRSQLVGGSFDSEVMRVREALSWSQLTDLEALKAAVVLAEQVHQQTVLTASGHRRLWASLEFQNFVSAIAHRAAKADATQTLSHRFVDMARPPEIPPPAADDTNRSINSLVLRSQLESQGLHAAWLAPISADELMASMTGEAAIYRPIVAAFAQGRFPGSSLMQVSIGLSYGAVALCVVILWGASIGFALGRLHHRSALWRLWVAFVIAFGAWPLSILIFLWRQRRRS